MEKKYAFLLMGSDYDPETDQAVFIKKAGSGGGESGTYLYTVRDFEEACRLAVKLKEEGFGAIELCGAFGKEKAEQITQLTGNTVAVGYVIHEPELDPLFQAFFGG